LTHQLLKHIIIHIKHTFNMKIRSMEVCEDNKDDRSTHQDALNRFLHLMG
jgi:hypothetical protein